MTSSDIEETGTKGPRVRAVPAVSRAIAILRLLGQRAQPMPLKTISDELGMVTSTCLHILRVLVHEGLVKVDAGSKRYELGVGMLSLARSVIDSSPFPTIVQPILDRVSQAWGVTAIGVEVTGVEHMVVLALSRSRMPFRLHVDVGSRFPAFLSATGRLVAAFTDLDAREVDRRFRALRWDQAPDIDAWRQEVRAVRRLGYSVDRGNYINGVVVVAVPVFDASDRMTHALVAAALADSLPDDRVAALAQDLCEEAATLSSLITTRG